MSILKSRRFFPLFLTQFLGAFNDNLFKTALAMLITFRLASSRYRIKELLDIMARDEISTPDKIKQLKNELNDHLHTNLFSKCQSMGQVVKRQLKQTLQKNLMLVQRNLGKSSD